MAAAPSRSVSPPSTSAAVVYLMGGRSHYGPHLREMVTATAEASSRLEGFMFDEDDDHGLAIALSLVATIISVISLLVYVGQHGWK